MIDDPPVATTPGTVTCSTCRFLGSEDPAAGSSFSTWPDPGTCSIRSQRIANPAQSYCANHPEQSPGFDPIPVGPVMDRGKDDEGQRTVANPSPDSPRIRAHLIDILEHIQVCRPADLTPREAAAIWQLELFGERRAYVQLDRIAGDMASTRESLAALTLFAPGMLELKVAGRLIDKIAGQEVTPEDHEGRDVYWIERFTIPGRLLLLSTIVVGGASIFFALDYLKENVAPGTRMPIYLFVVVAFVGAGAFLAAGAFVFRLLGIPFLGTGRGTRRRG